MQSIYQDEEITAYILSLFCVIFALWFVLKGRISCFSLTALDLAIGVYGIYGIANLWINEGTRIEIADICRWTLVAMTYIGVRCLNNKIGILSVVIISGIEESVVAICQKLGVLESQHSRFDVTGHLGNPGPLGGYLTICLIVCFCLLCIAWQARKRWVVFGLLTGSILITIGVVLADSRAAILGLLVGAMYLYFISNINVLRRYCLKFMCMGSFILVICIALLYQYRPQSADARLLVWRISTEMIRDEVFLGHGVGAFKWKYMLYQAKYFGKGRDTLEVMTTDNVAYPYNELLHSVIEIGIISLLPICAIGVIIYWDTSQDIVQRFVKAGLVTWFVFSMFSYPTEILPLMLLLPLLLGCIKRRALFTYVIYPRFICMIFILCMMVCVSAVKVGCFYRKFSDKLILLLQDNEAEVEYVEICYPVMKNSAKFNIVYSKWLAKQIKSSPEGIERMNGIIPTCENYCLLGDFYRARERFSEAENYYMLASSMIPTRMKPNYKLWSLYVQMKNIEKAVIAARFILQQPLKVESSFTINARTEVKLFLDRVVISREL